MSEGAPRTRHAPLLWGALALLGLQLARRAFTDGAPNPHVQEARQEPEPHDGEFDLLFAKSPQPAWIYDVETLAFLAVNDAAVAQYGYAREEFLDMRLTDIRPPEDVPAFLEGLKMPRPTLQSGVAWRHHRKDGSILDVEISSHLLVYHGHNAALVSIHDITARERAYHDLTRERDFIAALLDTVGSLVVVLNREGRIISFNRACELTIGYTFAEVKDRPWWEFLPPDEQQMVRQRVDAVLRGDDVSSSETQGENTWICKDGRSRRILWSNRLLRDKQGSAEFVISAGIDVTDQREALDEMARLSRQHSLILDSAGEGIFGLDRQGYTTFANPAAARMLGHEMDELVGQVHHSLMHHAYADGRPYPRPYCRIYAALTDGGVHQVNDEVFWRKDGSSFPVEYRSTPIIEEGQIRGAVVTFTDITDRKRAEAILEHQASHDSLTNLPNRVRLRERLETILATSRAKGYAMALLLLDLDHFKEINDTLGHYVGDLLLQDVSARLLEAIGATDTIARLGGDEFAVILPAADLEAAVAVAQMLAAALGGPFAIQGHNLAVEVSIGISLAPEHGDDAETLLRHADVAMYTAKRTRSGHALYDAANDQYSPRRLALLRDLRQVIARDQLRLHYQPKLAHDGSFHGVEVLLRWQHPEHGFIPPDQFIPLAEQTGVIDALTVWVLDAALRQQQQWRDAGIAVPVAVNLSARNLLDVTLPVTVAGLIEHHAALPEQITLELTESSLMSDPARALDILTRLHNLGIRLAIDDFGTGYSSLGYLKDLPVDEVKVDRSFVRSMAAATAPKDVAIVRSVIAMAHELSLAVVAEGVEDEATWDMLVALGCDAIQGYFISRPVPAPDLERWLATARPLAYAGASRDWLV